MKTHELLKEHIGNIDYNPKDIPTTPFLDEVINFTEQNQMFENDVLIQKFTKQFGERVELREKYTLYKTLKTIKKWVIFFGVILIVEIIAGTLIAGIYLF